MLDKIKEDICLEYNILGVDEDNSTISVEFMNPYAGKKVDDAVKNHTRNIPIKLDAEGDLDETALYESICQLSFGIKAKMDLAHSKDNSRTDKRKAHVSAIKKFGRKPKLKLNTRQGADALDAPAKKGTTSGAKKPKKDK